MSVKRLQNKKRLLKNAATGLLLGAALGFAGCEAINFPLTVAEAPLSVPGAVSPSQAGPASNSSLPGTKPAPASSTSVPGSIPGSSVPSAPVSTTGEEALAVYEAARRDTKSDKMTHLWSVESQYPLKTGEIILEANYGAGGSILTAKGSSLERVGNEEKQTLWYQTRDEYALEQNGAVRRFPLTDIRRDPAYDIPGLSAKILTEYSVTLESGTWFVKLTTQSEPEIRDLMEKLGYRKTGEGAYAGSLYLEAMVEEKTGYLRMVNYIFRHRSAGYTDNGSVSFTGQNRAIEVVIPEPGPVTQPGSTSATP